MAATQPPLFIDVNGVIDAADLGLPFRDLLGEGVVNTSDLAVAQRGAGANMSVDVAAGAAWVKGDDDAAAQPTYRVRNDATVNVAIAGADASKPRIDRIVARVYDSAFAGVSLTWAIEVVAGTPTTGATLVNLNGATAVPHTALLLANVLVPASTSSIVTADIGDVRLFASVGEGSAARSVGSEIAYDQITSSVTVTGTSVGSPTTLITGGSHSYDGTPVMVEFYSQGVLAPSPNDGYIRFLLFEDGVKIGQIGEVAASGTANTPEVPVIGRVRITPAPGAHTYAVKAYVSSTTGTPTVTGLNGVSDNPVPAYLRITKV